MRLVRHQQVFLRKTEEQATCRGDDMALNDYLLISPRRYVEVPARNTISDQGVKRTSLNTVNKNAARMISIINMASNLDDLNIANVSKE